MSKILVMCTGNSFRSQMAEGFLRFFSDGKNEVFSTGVKANGKVNELAKLVMAEEGIDLSTHSSDKIELYLSEHFDYIITVCDNAKAVCPDFPNSTGKRIHQSFPDLEKDEDATEEETLAAVRVIRDAIKEYCREFIASI